MPSLDASLRLFFAPFAARLSFEMSRQRRDWKTNVKIRIYLGQEDSREELHKPRGYD
jgi:hypothetical protein